MNKGKTEPRIYTPPLRELPHDTTLGFEAVAFAEDVLRLELIPWQRWLLIHALETIDTPDGWRFRFKNVQILIGRQNGKTTLGAILSLYFLYCLRTGLVIGTAQDLEQAEDTWAMCVEFAQENVFAFKAANGSGVRAALSEALQAAFGRTMGFDYRQVAAVTEPAVIEEPAPAVQPAVPAAEPVPEPTPAPEPAREPAPAPEPEPTPEPFFVEDDGAPIPEPFYADPVYEDDIVDAEPTMFAAAQPSESAIENASVLPDDLGEDVQNFLMGFGDGIIIEEIDD